MPSSVDTGLYLNLTTIGLPVSVQYRALPSTGKTLTALNYGEVLATLTASAFDTTLNNDGAGSNLRASYTFAAATSTPLRTLYATFSDNRTSTSVSFSRSILVDDVAPLVTLTSGANASVTLGGSTASAYVLTGTAQDTDAIIPRNNAISGIGDIKVIAHRTFNANGSATMATDPTTYLVVPTQITFGPEAVAPPFDSPLVGDAVIWQAILPSTAFAGTYDFDIVATDNAGNRTTISSASRVVNFTVPTATLNTIKNAGGTDVSGGVAGGTLTFNISASAAVGTLASYQIIDTYQGTATIIKNAAPGVATIVSQNVFNYPTAPPAAPPVPDGLHIFTLIVTDSQGNTTTTAPKIVTIDNTAPVAAVTSPQNGTAASAGSQIVGAISDVNPSLTASDVYFSFNGVRDNNPVTLDSTGRIVTSVIPASALGAATTITLTAKDKAGNTGVSPSITVGITSPITGLSDIDSVALNPADGSPVTRHNILPAPQTYLRSVFAAFGTIGSVVNGAALKSWTLVLYDTTTNAIARTVGTGTTAQTAALLGSTDTTGLTDTDAYLLRLDLTDVNNVTTTGTVGSGTAAAVTVDNTTPVITNADVNSVNGTFFNNTPPKTLAGTSTDANPGKTYLLVDNALFPNSAGTLGTGVSQPTTGLAEGVHTFNVVAVDQAGNRTAATPAKTFTIDNTGPILSVICPQDGATVAAGTPLIGVVSDINPSHNVSDVHFNYSYNAGVNTGPIAVTLDATGRTANAVIPALFAGHSVAISLTATDLAGNTATSTAIEITVPVATNTLNRVDTTVLNPQDGLPLPQQNNLPATQTYLRRSFSVFGTISPNNLQSWTVNLVSVADLANAAAVPVLTVGSGTTAQSAALLGSANSTSIADGAYYLRLDVTNAGVTTLGTVVNGTAAAVTVDNTAPTIANADVNNVNGLFFNNSTSPKTLAGTYTDANPGSAYLLVDNSLFPNSAGTPGTSVSKPTTGLAEGVHTFNIIAIDLAGNRNVSTQTNAFTIDNALPIVTITTPSPLSTTTVGAQIVGVISDTNPTTDVAQVYFSYNGVRDNNPVTLDSTGRIVTSIIPASALGANTAVTLTAKDKAGNTGVSPAIIITVNNPTTGLSEIDTEGQNAADGTTVTLRSPALNSGQSLAAITTYIRGKFSVFGTVSGIVNGGALQSWTVKLYDTTTNGAPLSVGSGTTAQSAALLGMADTAGLDQTHTYLLRLDIVTSNGSIIGTTGNGTAAAVIVDNTAPVITNADVNSVNGLFFNNLTSPKLLAGTSSDLNTGSTYVLVDNALFPNSAGTLGSTVSQSTSPLAEGIHAFSVVAVDKAGNRTASAPAKTFTIDNTAPVVAVTSPPNNTATVVGAQITGSVADINPSTNPANVYFSYNGVQDNNLVIITSDGAAITSVIPVTASGTVSVTLTATDKAGNTKTSPAFTITLNTQITGLSEIDAFTQNPADGTLVNRQNVLPAPQTYIRGKFSVIGTVSGVVIATAKTLQSWTLNLVNVSDLARQLDPAAMPPVLPALAVGSGTSPQSAAQLSLFNPPNSAAIPDGVYYLRLDLKDVDGVFTLGTIAAGTAAAVTVDNTPPVITNADVNHVTGTFFNNITSPKNLAGTATDANMNANLAAMYVLVDNALYPNSAGTAGASVSQSTTGLGEGSHTFSIVALDKAGNRTLVTPNAVPEVIQSDPDPRIIPPGKFYIDNTPISVTGLTVTPSVVSTQTSTITNSGSAANGSSLLLVGGNNLTVSATLTDNTDPRNRVQWAIEFFRSTSTGLKSAVKRDGSPFLPNDTLAISGINNQPGLGTLPVSFKDGQLAITAGLSTTSLPNGRYALIVIAVDKAGNSTHSALEIQVLNGGDSTATGLPGAALLAYAVPSANQQYSPGSVQGVTPTLAQIDGKVPLLPSSVVFRSDHILDSLSNLKSPANLVPPVSTGMFDQYGNLVANPDTNPGDNGTQTLYTASAFFVEASIFQSANAALSVTSTRVRVIDPITSTRLLAVDPIPSLSSGASNPDNPPATTPPAPTVNLDNSAKPFTYSLSRTVPAGYQFVLIAADPANKAAKPALLNIVLDPIPPVLTMNLPVAQQTYSPGDILVLDFIVAKLPHVYGPNDYAPPAPIKRLLRPNLAATYDSAPDCKVFVTPANATTPRIGPFLPASNTVTGPTMSTRGYDLDTALNNPDLQVPANFGAAVVTGDAFTFYRVRWQIRLFSQFFSANTSYNMHIAGLQDVAGNTIPEQIVPFRVGN